MIYVIAVPTPWRITTEKYENQVVTPVAGVKVVARPTPTPQTDHAIMAINIRLGVSESLCVELNALLTYTEISQFMMPALAQPGVNTANMKPNSAKRGFIGDLADTLVGELWLCLTGDLADTLVELQEEKVGTVVVPHHAPGY